MADRVFGFAGYEPRPLEIIDTTLREGAQTSLMHDHAKYAFGTDDKVEIARALILYGVKFIELFSPSVHPRERDDLAAIRESRDDLITQTGYTFLLAHVRCHPDDVSEAIDAGVDGLNLFFGTSLLSRRHSHGSDLDEIARRARDLIEAVRRDYPHLILRFSGEDAFRTPLDELYRVYDPIAPLVDRLGMPDTVGVATPEAVRVRLLQLANRYPDAAWEAHYHDDRGFAVINALAAIDVGAQYINTTVLGLGERTGIPSMTALLFNLYVSGRHRLLDGYHLTESYPLNVLVADKLHMLVNDKEPVSLTNRTHTAGIHQKAVLSDPSTYEAHPLVQFGVTEAEILLGPLSGWNVIHYFLKEIHYLEIDEPTAREITAVFKERVLSIEALDRPAELLLRIAVDEFELQPSTEPSPGHTNVYQNFDAPQKARVVVAPAGGAGAGE
jgi:homocitrate synthase